MSKAKHRRRVGLYADLELNLELTWYLLGTKIYFFMKPDKIVVRVYGKTLDENYMRMLYDHPEFDVETVYLLDCVQKKQPLNQEQYKRFR